MRETIDRTFLPALHTPSMPLQREWMIQPLHIAASAIKRLWEEGGYSGIPLILQIKEQDTRRYHPALLEKTIRRLSKHKTSKGKLIQWELLTAPSYAGEIGAIPLHDGIFGANFQGYAGFFDKGTVPGPLREGWFSYHFEGWDALAVRISTEDEDEVQGFIIIPDGRQDHWLAFNAELNATYNALLQRERKSCIDILGVSAEERSHILNEIRKTTLDHVILPPDVIDLVLSQQIIFQPQILQRYAMLHVPRLRKALLIGPPGAGKSTLTKALASAHQRKGGYVAYVFAGDGGARAWRLLHNALNSAVNSNLPTLVVVEDLENFVTREEDMQSVLNVLDGAATPDNPAGTLILATTNAPDRIDRRITQRPGRIDIMIEIGAIKTQEQAIRFLRQFLHTSYCAEEHDPIACKLINQVGSHVREICLLSSIKALEQGHDQVSYKNLLWAHEALLDGRKAAADMNTCEPPSAKGNNSVGFGKHKE